MSQRYWVTTIAFGLIALASLGQAQDQTTQPDRKANTEQAPAYKLPFTLPVDIVEDKPATEASERHEAEARQREKDDLVAQQGMNMATQAMNKATQDMALYALISTFLVGIGTALLFYTLHLTRQANKAAHDAVRVTEETARDATRAYVHVNKAELHWGNRYAGSPGVTLTVCNTGATPAKWFAISSRVIVSYWTEDGPPEDTEFASVQLPDEPFVWNGIGANAELTAPGLRATDKDELTKAIRNIVRIDALGVIKYETFFGEIFESEFWFVARGPLDYMVRDIDGGMRSEEVPHKMVRAAGRLRTYEKMKA